MAEPSILLVDDDTDIREIVSEVLELHGYSVITACDGAEALSLLRKRAQEPRLILLDLMMPGMNGMEFRAIQCSDPALASIPVVILSGDARMNQKAASLGLPGVKKPVELHELLQVVARYCPTDSDLPTGGAGGASRRR
jgi:CheY-like chemotaxis protein